MNDLRQAIKNEIPAGAITVVIVTYNSASTILQSLEALSRQTLKPSRVIVVDNASSDESVDLMRKSFPNNEYLLLTENIGFAAANNRAIEMCSTEFIALLNPDAFPNPDWLSKLFSATSRYPMAASFGSKQLIFTDSNLIDGIGDVYHYSGLMWRNGNGKPQNFFYSEECEIFSPCAAAALYRLSALKEVQGFDEDFFCYAEDVDLGFRLRLAGWKAIYVPDAVVSHVGGATTGGKNSNFSIYYGHRNLVWTFVKNMPSCLFWIFLPSHILLNFFTLLWFSFKGKRQIIFQAKFDAIKGLQTQIRKRSQIQNMRKARVISIFNILNKGFIK